MNDIDPEALRQVMSKLGQVRSAKKAEASRRNGLLGGRPERKGVVCENRGTEADKEVQGDRSV